MIYSQGSVNLCVGAHRLASNICSSILRGTALEEYCLGKMLRLCLMILSISSVLFLSRQSFSVFLHNNRDSTIDAQNPAKDATTMGEDIFSFNMRAIQDEKKMGRKGAISGCCARCDNRKKRVQVGGDGGNSPMSIERKCTDRDRLYGHRLFQSRCPCFRKSVSIRVLDPGNAKVSVYPF
jgi:hypothetical protein